MHVTSRSFVAALIAALNDFETDGFRVTSCVCNFVESLRSRPEDEVSFRDYFYAVAMERIGLPVGERWCPGPIRDQCRPSLRSPYLDYLEKNDRVGAVSPLGHPIQNIVLDPNKAMYALVKYLDLDRWMVHVREVRALIKEELFLQLDRFPEMQMKQGRPTVRSLTDLLVTAAGTFGFELLRDRSKRTKSLLFSRSIGESACLLLLADELQDVISGGRVEPEICGMRHGCAPRS